MAASGKPWTVIHQGGFITRASTRKAAMNVLDRGISVYRGGVGMVKRDHTGETWVRRGGSWFPIKKEQA